MNEKFIHGADYYPEQWLSAPDILTEDIRLMKLAHINTVTLGVFAWAALEPEEGVWDFGWLDKVMDNLYENGIQVILATPSGARPAWLAEKYPEVLRVRPDRTRNLYGMRMNHCYTSAVYRQLVTEIDERLAERYGKHPAVIAWHISNEYHGECHCPLCQEAFRDFLKKKYGSLAELNQAWWTGFWSKKYTSWEQIESPSPIGEQAVQGLELDWKRFVTAQTVEFMNMEIRAVRKYSSEIPVTTNMIGSFLEVDYHRMAEHLDFASTDCYPEWGRLSDRETAIQAGFEYDVIRSLKREPFWLMETTPSMTNWAEVGKPKAPGLHIPACLQAVAHGANTVQYFQWRKSRGAYEKFHGAVVGHCGHENTRVFREVAQLGKQLEKAAELLETNVKAQVAILYDWNNRWAIEGSKGPRRDKLHEEIVREQYAAFRELGVDVDIIEEGQSLERYRLVAAPMLYLVKKGMAERLTDFVKNGGCLIITFFSGIVDENDLCFLGGFPGPLKELAGIWVEETNFLYPEEKIGFQQVKGLEAEDQNTVWKCRDYCELIHPLTAEVQAVYTDSWYQGMPALTSHVLGKGQTWYLAARPEKVFLRTFYQKRLEEAGVRCYPQLPKEVTLSVRENDSHRYLFFINWSENPQEVEFPEGEDILTGESCSGKRQMTPLEVRILKTNLETMTNINMKGFR